MFGLLLGPLIAVAGALPSGVRTRTGPWAELGTPAVHSEAAGEGGLLLVGQNGFQVRSHRVDHGAQLAPVPGAKRVEALGGAGDDPFDFPALLGGIGLDDALNHLFKASGTPKAAETLEAFVRPPRVHHRPEYDAQQERRNQERDGFGAGGEAQPVGHGRGR